MKKLQLLAFLFLLIPSISLSAKTKRVNRGPKNIERHQDGSVSLGSVFPDQGLVDPHSWVENGRVYVFCGHDESWRTTDTWRMNRWEIWSSADLINWKHENDILPTDTYIGDQPNCWAGDICERDGKYYWFFSNAHHDTGVMVADKITGPYKDLLGKPLLPKGIIKGKPYDPEIFIENGEYYICFSAGTYHIAKLSKDMKSLATEPQPILVTFNGKKVATKDKSTIHKKGDKYYLLYSDRYAISSSLFGPYELQSETTTGGHNSIFTLNGQDYLIYEFGETYNFFRGTGLKPIYFDENGKATVPKSEIPHNPTTTFEFSEQGWCAEEGTTSVWNKKGYIEGKINAKGAYISSIPYVRETTKSKFITFDFVNKTDSERLRVTASTFTPIAVRGFYENIAPIDWDNTPFVDVEVIPNSSEVQKVKIDVSKFGKLEESFRQIRIEPAPDASKGKWIIDNILIK